MSIQPPERRLVTEASLADPDSPAHATLLGTIGAEQTPSLAVAEATIRSTARSMAGSILARNQRANPPTFVQILTGGPEDGTPATFSGQTITNVLSPSGKGRAWRIDTPTAPCRLDLTLPHGPIDPGPVAAVSMWVHIPDPAVVTSAQVILTGATGTWSRVTDQTGSNLTGKPFRPGWNLCRWTSTAGNLANLTGITAASVRLVCTAATRVHIGPVVLETRPKATLCFINDWGSKPFYDNGYPLLKALGVPVTWALRVGLLGQGEYPDNHVTLEEARTIASENGNAISYHSWDGTPTATAPPEEALRVTMKCMAGLQSLGLWSDAALFRPAWVQNLATGAAATNPYLVASASPSDNWGTTPWPPIDRHNIMRDSPAGRSTAQIDAWFATLEATHGAALIYTHGVIPGEGTANHTDQATFAYFVSKVEAAMAAGWLEAATVPQLVEREWLELPRAPL